MNKKITFLATLGLTLSCAFALTNNINKLTAQEEAGSVIHYVDFFNNYKRKPFLLKGLINCCYLSILRHSWQRPRHHYMR